MKKHKLTTAEKAMHKLFEGGLLLQIPLKPVSLNSCFRGKRYKTNDYKAWRENFVILARRKIQFKWCRIRIDFYTPSYSSVDVDNLIKPVLDGLSDAGILLNDKYVKSVLAEKHRGQHNIIIQIEEAH